MTIITTIPTYAELQNARAQAVDAYQQAAEAYAPYRQARLALIILRGSVASQRGGFAAVTLLITDLNDLAGPAQKAYHDAADALDRAIAECKAWGI
jgi:hypothetical protein